MRQEKCVPDLEYTDLGGGAVATLRPATAVGFNNARRVHKALSADLERKVLIWMAERLPVWVNSDHLTALGFAAMLLAGASYAFARVNSGGLILATIFLALNWFGDSLDGTLARVRDRQRPRYGFYVDHAVDAFGAAFLLAGLAFSGYMQPSVAALLLVTFLLLLLETCLAAYTLCTFQLSRSIFGPTEIRIVLAIGNTVLMFHPYAHVLGRRYLLFDLAGIVAAAIMAVMLVTTTVKHVCLLYGEEKLL